VRIARPARMAAAIGLVATVLVAGVFVTPATAASGNRRCPSGARSAITNAYYTLFSRNQSTATADERAEVLADGSDPALRQLLDTWLADPADNSTTVSVSDIRCTSNSRARLDADLLLASTPLLDVMPVGKAVRRAGAWKVARSTFCARLTISDPSLASRGACAR
jgi:hypothetical protein